MGDPFKWVYNTDNELSVKASQGDTSWGVAVTGAVEGGPSNNKWYRSTAECRGVSAPVSQADGTFTLPNVPLSLGANALVVTVTDVSGNHSQQTRNVTKTNNALENFAYDNNGNLTNWINGTTNWVYQWDWADRLIKATSNNVVVLENVYDAGSRRIAKTEVVNGQTQKWLYLSDGWDIVGVMDASGQLLETYTRGVGLAGDIGTLVAVNHHPDSSLLVTYYTHANQRGDVTLTRLATETVGTCDYSAFGTLKSQTGADVCRFKYSSKERDAATGWSYYGYRFYAPAWQRWLNRDPIQERGGINLYGFVMNNAISRIDRFGLRVTWWGGWRDNDVPAAERDCYNRCMEQGEAGRWLALTFNGAVGGFVAGELAGSFTGPGSIIPGGIGAVGGAASGWATGYFLTSYADDICKSLCYHTPCP